MKSIVLSITLFPLTIVAMNQPQELTIKNNSTQKVSLYYNEGTLGTYATIKALISEKIKLTVPQKITVHFHDLDFQQRIKITNTQEPLIIVQHNIIDITQNRGFFTDSISFNPHRPSLTVQKICPQHRPKNTKSSTSLSSSETD